MDRSELKTAIKQMAGEMSAGLPLHFLVSETIKQQPNVVLRMILLLPPETTSKVNDIFKLNQHLDKSQIVMIDNLPPEIGMVPIEADINLKNSHPFLMGQTLMNALRNFTFIFLRDAGFTPSQSTIFFLPAEQPHTFVLFALRHSRSDDVPYALHSYFAPQQVRSDLLPVEGIQEKVARLAVITIEELAKKNVQMANYIKSVAEMALENILAFGRLPEHIKPIEEQLREGVFGEYGSDDYPESDIFFQEFLTPLILLSYQTNIQMLLEAVERADSREETEQAMKNLIDLCVFLQIYIYAHINVAAMMPYKENVNRLFNVSFPEQMEVEAKNMRAMYQWLKSLLDYENWQGDPPFFIHLPENSFPDLPRMVLTLHGEMVGFVHEFGGTLIFPKPLTPEQTREMWNYLAQFYDDENGEVNKVAWQYKKKVYELLLQHGELAGGTTHVELCCGAGNIQTIIEKTFGKEQIEVKGFDISDEMIERAQNRGMAAERLDLNAEKLPLEDQSVNTVNVSFGEMWLKFDHVFPEVFRVLKPGGRFTFNIYNTNPDHIAKIQEGLTEAGFEWELKKERFQIGDESELVSNHQGFKEALIMVAHKP